MISVYDSFFRKYSGCQKSESSYSFVAQKGEMYVLDKKNAVVGLSMRIVIGDCLPHVFQHMLCNICSNYGLSFVLPMWIDDMAKELSEEVRGEIMALIKGLSHRQIAARMRVSKGAVQRTAERFTRTNAYSTLPRSGRPKCTTPQQDRFIKITSLRNRRATAGNIQALVNATGGKTISKTTVRKRLAACGLKGRVAVSKPLLRSKNKRKRLLWAKRYTNYSIEDWKTVLFVDESKFEIHGNNRRIYVRRRPGERLSSQLVY